jgi:hypothetical protein
MSLSNLTDEGITAGREMIYMAKDGCKQINDTLTDMLTFQVYFAASLALAHC